MGWREDFNKTDISADRLGYWWTIFGPSAVLSVLMSGIAAGFTSIAQYGWGAIVFAGVGAACVIMFAASALMVSWRYFNPLPKQPATPSESREVSTQDISSRLAEIERGIAQNKAGLGELRTKAEVSTQDISSRLAEVERGIALNKAGLEEVRTKAALLTRSLRAKDAQSIIKEADQVVMSTYKKLLEEPHPDEAAWADDYAAWEKAMSRIDDLMSQWTHQHHVPFLNTRLKDSEASVPPPQHIKSDANATRYKTAWLAQSNYANKREGLFGYFAALIGDV
jgi:hypothetical protein